MRESWLETLRWPITAVGEEAVCWGVPGSLEHLCGDETNSGRGKP